MSKENSRARRLAHDPNPCDWIRIHSRCSSQFRASCSFQESHNLQPNPTQPLPYPPLSSSFHHTTSLHSSDLLSSPVAKSNSSSNTNNSSSSSTRSSILLVLVRPVPTYVRYNGVSSWLFWLPSDLGEHVFLAGKVFPGALRSFPSPIPRTPVQARDIPINNWIEIRIGRSAWVAALVSDHLARSFFLSFFLSRESQPPPQFPSPLLPPCCCCCCCQCNPMAAVSNRTNRPAQTFVQLSFTTLPLVRCFFSSVPLPLLFCDLVYCIRTVLGLRSPSSSVPTSTFSSPEALSRTLSPSALPSSSPMCSFACGRGLRKGVARVVDGPPPSLPHQSGPLANPSLHLLRLMRERKSWIHFNFIISTPTLEKEPPW